MADTDGVVSSEAVKVLAEFAAFYKLVRVKPEDEGGGGRFEDVMDFQTSGMKAAAEHFGGIVTPEFLMGVIAGAMLTEKLRKIQQGKDPANGVPPTLLLLALGKAATQMGIDPDERILTELKDVPTGELIGGLFR